MKKIRHKYGASRTGINFKGCRCDSCKEGNRAYQRARWARLHPKKEREDKTKQTMVCAHCQEEFNRDSRLSDGQWKTRKYCSHYCLSKGRDKAKLREWGRNSWNTRKRGHIKPLVHGTTTGYRTHKCRCDRCRVAHRIQTNERNRRKAFLSLPKKVRLEQSKELIEKFKSVFK